MTTLESLISDIRDCRHCVDSLPCGPRPILSASAESRILIMGQAPGRRVHQSGVAWDDPSGQRLREWLAVDSNAFYDVHNFAIVPMGFCYPGSGKSGDLPPRPECAQLWHARLLKKLTNVELTLTIGRYAHDYVLGKRAKSTLTETVRGWKDYRPKVIPLPHPSPRNNRWLKTNPWFEQQVLPYLQRRVKRILAGG